MKDLLFATNNKNKIREALRIANKFKVNLLTLSDFNSTCDPEENFETVVENAIHKAREFYAETKHPVIAEDFGFFVKSLPEVLGVKTKRYCPCDCKGELRDKHNNLLLLQNVKENREAYYMTCLAFYDGNQLITAIGYTNGKISIEEKGENGFAYDKVFIPYENGLNKTIAELSESEKDLISSRGKAFENLFSQLNLIY